MIAQQLINRGESLNSQLFTIISFLSRFSTMDEGNGCWYLFLFLFPSFFFLLIRSKIRQRKKKIDLRTFTLTMCSFDDPICDWTSIDEKRTTAYINSWKQKKKKKNELSSLENKFLSCWWGRNKFKSTRKDSCFFIEF